MIHETFNRNVVNLINASKTDMITDNRAYHSLMVNVGVPSINIQVPSTPNGQFKLTDVGTFKYDRRQKALWVRRASLITERGGVDEMLTYTGTFPLLSLATFYRAQLLLRRVLRDVIRENRLIVTSTLRSSGNSEPGYEHSWHVMGRAFDMKIKGMTVEEMVAHVNTCMRRQEVKSWKIIPYNSFIHVDFRGQLL